MLQVSELWLSTVLMIELALVPRGRPRQGDRECRTESRIGLRALMELPGSLKKQE